MLLIVAISAPVLAVILAGIVYVANLKKVPPNKVGIFTGRGKESVYVRGASKFRMPGFVQYDEILLEPIPIEIQLRDALSKENVPINVDAVGLVRLGTSDQMLKTSVERFLSSDKAALKNQINEILNGSLRGVVAKMTPEEINSDRDQLRTNVIDDAGSSLANIGMEVDVLTIATISDSVGYLSSLGEKRTAEVKRDAIIAKANADRDSRIQSADAKRASETAEAEAETAIAQANEERDRELAQIKARIDAEQATAAQAGPLADQQARKAVVVAQEQANAAQEEAAVQVELKKAERERAAQEARIVVPARAAREAAVERAEGEKQAAILAGQAEAEARKAAAAAVETEQRAEAAGLLARLSAEAEGQQKLAAALNAFGPDARQLKLAPDYLDALVKSVAAAAKPVEGIERISVIGSSSDAGDTIGLLQGVSPKSVAKIVEVLRENNIDIASLLGSSGSSEQPVANASVEEKTAV